MEQERIDALPVKRCVRLDDTVCSPGIFNITGDCSHGSTASKPVLASVYSVSHRSQAKNIGKTQRFMTKCCKGSKQRISRKSRKFCADDPSIEYDCKICLKVFPLKALLRYHMEMKHCTVSSISQEDAAQWNTRDTQVKDSDVPMNCKGQSGHKKPTKTSVNCNSEDWKDDVELLEPNTLPSNATLNPNYKNGSCTESVTTTNTVGACPQNIPSPNGRLNDEKCVLDALGFSNAAKGTQSKRVEKSKHRRKGIPVRRSLYEHVTEEDSDDENFRREKCAAPFYEVDNGVLNHAPLTMVKLVDYQSNDESHGSDFIAESEDNESIAIMKDESNADALYQTNELGKVSTLPIVLDDGKKVFSCPMCSRIFSKRFQLLAHLKYHNLPSRYCCGQCSHSFKLGYQLKQHLKQHSPNGMSNNPKTIVAYFSDFPPETPVIGQHLSFNRDEKVCCPVCKRQFSRIFNFAAHCNVVHAGPSGWRLEFTCSLCSRLFRNFYSYQRHMWRHEANKSHSHYCHQCHRVFGTEMSMARHTCAAHICPNCNKAYTTPAGLTEHFAECHFAVGKPSDYKCSICNRKFFLLKGLSHHMRLQHCAGASSKYKCSRCTASFSSDIDREKHFKMLHTDIQCETCGKKFGGRNLLRRHMVSHLTERNFSCPVCHKAYKTEFRMREHARCSHTENFEEVFGASANITQHKCELCARWFKSKSDLNKHQRVHTNERPFKCDHCPSQFKQHGHLTSHLQYKHRTFWEEKHGPIEFKHTCGQCGKAFLAKCALTKHLKHHTRMEKLAAETATLEKMQTLLGLKMEEIVEVNKNN